MIFPAYAILNAKGWDVGAVLTHEQLCCLVSTGFVGTWVVWSRGQPVEAIGC